LYGRPQRDRSYAPARVHFVRATTEGSLLRARPRAFCTGDHRGIAPTRPPACILYGRPQRDRSYAPARVHFVRATIRDRPYAPARVHFVRATTRDRPYAPARVHFVQATTRDRPCAPARVHFVRATTRDRSYAPARVHFVRATTEGSPLRARPRAFCTGDHRGIGPTRPPACILYGRPQRDRPYEHIATRNPRDLFGRKVASMR